MNYKIIGSDQKEYGPVSLEQLRQWVAEGRMNGQTMVQPEGGTDWQPLSTFPELMPLAAPAAAPLPTSEPVTGKAPAAVVRVPAILLMIVGGLGVALALFGVIRPFLGISDLWAMDLLMPLLPPDVASKMAEAMRAMQAGQGSQAAIRVPLGILSLGFSAVILFGGLSMIKLQRWGLALAAAIMAIVCGNPCCCPIGLVAGIWGLVVLSKAEIKAAFH